MVTTAAIGAYRTREDASRAVDELERAGFRRLDIRVLFPDNQATREFARLNDTIPPEGTATGLTAQMDLEGTLGVTTPRTGPIRGALPDALRDMGIPDDEAEKYGEFVKAGGILFSLNCDTGADVSRAVVVLRRTGAELTAATGTNVARRASPSLQGP